MKIIHLISGGDSGGAKTHVFTLLKALQQQINVQLVCLIDGPFYREATEIGINVVLLEQKNRLDFSVLKVLTDKIKDEKVDILHCHGARANLIAVVLKKKIKIPIITTVHSDYKLDFVHSFYKKIIFTGVNRFCLKRMDYYFPVTNIFKEMLGQQGFDRKKMFTIYNGIEIIDSIKERKVIIPVFGCVTTLRPIKGTHVLLEAVDLCVKKGYKPQVLIAGTGQGKYVQGLYDYVDDHRLQEFIKFKGFVSDMDDFYNQVDAVILPSFTESFPYALLEAGIRKKGVIASKAGGIVEMIKDKKTGMLFDVGEAEQLADLIIEFMETPSRCLEYGEVFREKIIESFSDKAMAESHINNYKIIG